MFYKKGVLVWVDFGDTVGSEQRGIRPAVIVQNDVGNKYSPCVIVAPITSRPKRNLPTHVGIKGGFNGLPMNSTILLEQPRTFDKSRIKEIIGYASPEELLKVDLALLVSFGISQSLVSHTF